MAREVYRDRRDAGRVLADRLKAYAKRSDVLVLALPRGGVPVAVEVAEALDASLDVFLVRKLGVPGQPELGFGAIATGGIRLLNPSIVAHFGISSSIVDEVVLAESNELARREREYRGDPPPPILRGKTVVLVDDGLATGVSMRAAVAAARRGDPARLIVASPVAPASICDELNALVDEVVCVQTPEPFDAVGHWYQDFTQTTDEDVRALLAETAKLTSIELGIDHGV